MSAHVVPLWLAQATQEAGTEPLLTARLAWRLRSTEAAALGASAPWLHQALIDVGIPPGDVAEISRAVAADIGRRRGRIAELGVIGGLMSRNGGLGGDEGMARPGGPDR